MILFTTKPSVMKYIFPIVLRSFAVLAYYSIFLIVTPIAYIGVLFWEFSFKKAKEVVFVSFEDILIWDLNTYQQEGDVLTVEVDRNRIYRTPLHYIRNISIAKESKN